MSDGAIGSSPLPQADPLSEPAAHAAAILLAARHAIALTGAGISAESGIPTYRGRDGLWTKQGEPPLNQFQQFLADPGDWWERRRRRLSDPDALTRALIEAVPNDGHFALVELERLGVLRHTITQNIDNLHRLAGSRRLTEIHGNGFLLRCLQCGQRHDWDATPEGNPPRCPHCDGLLKSDTVLFGEPIPPDALASCFAEAEAADCLLLVGTTAVVSPAADFAWDISRRGRPLIEINPEPTVLTSRCALSIRAAAGDALPRIVDLVKRARPTG